VVAAPDGDVAVAPFENPALATGGTGDVLAGAIGALLGQGLTPFSAARLGVYLHGAAGDMGRERFGDSGLLAWDLPDGLAISRRRLASLAERRQTAKGLGFGSRERVAAAATVKPPADPDPIVRG
jgi:NAD(P)H-hydrate epimerase